MRAILTYHSIDGSGSPISVHPDEFHAHVRFLASGRLRVVPLEHLDHDAAEGDCVALTFDDGFANFGAAALPLLRDHGLRATVFVVAGRVGATNAWDRGSTVGIPELPLMDWDALGEASRVGVEIGGHSMTHADLTTVSDQQRSDEIAGSASEIAHRLGRRPTSFAYPYGAVDAPTARAASESYARACGTDLRLVASSDDRYRLPRLDMFYFRERGRLDAWGTPSFRRRLWLRATGRRVRSMAARVRVPR